MCDVAQMIFRVLYNSVNGRRTKCVVTETEGDEGAARLIFKKQHSECRHKCDISNFAKRSIKLNIDVENFE